MKRPDLIAAFALPFGVFVVLVVIGVLFIAVGLSKCAPFDGGLVVQRHDGRLVRLGATTLAVSMLMASGRGG